jgi:hypothetical protein
MAKTTVYGSFEVREGFGPRELGTLDLSTESRTEADARLEEKWAGGACVQLFGIRSSETGSDGERVLLRTLVTPKAA